MDEKLMIVHGYSDGSTSFEPLRDFFVDTAGFKKKNVFHLDYASMDDQATFLDFADKMDADYERHFKGERINIACHSTGALVVRAWLVLRRERQREHGKKQDCPVKRLMMFAPANFGSDLARLGQSFLGKFRCTFFNDFSRSQDFLESGRQVLQGLEPASPFQWVLSDVDLHEEDYFGPDEDPEQICFPFVFTAGRDYEGELQAELLKKRKKPGTDGTVRICGTSLNTRKCTLLFLRDSRPAEVNWHPERKFPRIPFAVFKDLNHGSIIAADEPAFRRRIGPKSLVLKALKVNSVSDYEAVYRDFLMLSKENYKQAQGRYKNQYQQFFFRVRDDVDDPILDYFIDFHVQDRNGEPVADLTEEFDETFESQFYTHSADTSCRVMMINCRKMSGFFRKLRESRSRLVFDIGATPPLPDIEYRKAFHVVYDGADGHNRDEHPSFIYPNTTTLVDVVLNRRQSGKLLRVSGHGRRPLPERGRGRAQPTGRGQLFG